MRQDDPCPYGRMILPSGSSIGCVWWTLLSISRHFLLPYSLKSGRLRIALSATSRNPIHVLPSSSEIAACSASRLVKTVSDRPVSSLLFSSGYSAGSRFGSGSVLFQKKRMRPSFSRRNVGIVFEAQNIGAGFGPSHVSPPSFDV